MSAPVRIQRKRTKGWRMPEGAVYVGRPTRWGNPWLVKKMGSCWVVHRPEWVPLDPFKTREAAVTSAVNLFRNAIAHTDLYDATVPFTSFVLQRQLAGRDLCCWCPLDSPCHADVLLEIANAGPASSD